MASFQIKKDDDGNFELYIDGQFESSWGAFYKDVVFDDKAYTLIRHMLTCAYEEGKRQKLYEVQEVLGIRHEH